MENCKVTLKSASALRRHLLTHSITAALGEGRGNMTNIERESLTPKNGDNAMSKAVIKDEAEPDSDNFTAPKRAKQPVNETSGCYVAKAMAKLGTMQW